MKSLFIVLSFIFLLFSSALVAAPATSSQKPTAQRVMIVLDASGSMRGLTQGKTKMSAAKSVLKNLLADWNEEIHVGLTAYGHREKGNCKDIEVLVPAGKLNKTKMNNAVQGIQPKGMTPLSAAVLKAANELQYSEQKATVILISDGQETCHMDPCQLAKQLEAKGVDFTTHVIGFDVSKKEQRGLKCLAKNTGGSFFEAKNAAELKSALSKVVTTVKKTHANNLQLSATLTKDGPAIDKGLSWSILSPQKTFEGKSLNYSYDAKPKFNLPAGNYIVRVTYGKVTVNENITIKKDEFLNKVIVVGAGHLKLSAVASKGGPSINKGLSWNIYSPEKTLEEKLKSVDYSYSAKPTFKLAPGQYNVKVRYGKATASEMVTVKGGALTQKTIVVNAGHLAVHAITHVGGSKIKRGVSWNVAHNKVNFEGKRSGVDYSYDANAVFKLSPGEYLLTVKHGSAKASTVAVVKAGERTEKVVSLNVGGVKMAAIPVKDGEALKSGVSWSVYSEQKDFQGNLKRITYSYNASPRFNLHSGKYIIEARYGSAKARVLVTITAGKLQNKAAVLNVGLIKMTAMQSGKIVKPNWSIKTSKKNLEGEHESVTRSYDKTPTFKLPAGDYIVFASYHHKTYQKPFSVKAGERRDLTIELK